MEKNSCTIKCTYEKIVEQLIYNRKKSGCTQEIVAIWLKVERRKIIDFENLKRFDIELMCNYCDVYGIDLKLNYDIN